MTILELGSEADQEERRQTTVHRLHRPIEYFLVFFPAGAQQTILSADQVMIQSQRTGYCLH